MTDRDLYIITGASSGIGLALATEALNKGADVIGISRNQSITHNCYNHVALDLSNAEAVARYSFLPLKNYDTIVLVNNAGWIGPLKAIEKQTAEEINRAYQINVVAPAVLSSVFLRETKHFHSKRKIIFISSGAANYPIHSWATYGSSKAAVDLLAQTIGLENQDVDVLSIAPGIVDTTMQQEIRSANPMDFPDSDRFKNYYLSGELTPPKDIAELLLKVIARSLTFEEKVFSLRNLKLN